MKSKELEQLKTRPVEDLKKMAQEHRDRLWQLKSDLAAGKVKNVKEIHKAKRDIAQILTILNNQS
ncbi:MAG: 50S ribosomal protein L29 [Patescibacteria group bacterium]